MTGFLLTAKQKLMLCINKRRYWTDRTDWRHWTNRPYRTDWSHRRDWGYWRHRTGRANWVNWRDWTHWANWRDWTHRTDRADWHDWTHRANWRDWTHWANWRDWTHWANWVNWRDWRNWTHRANRTGDQRSGLSLQPRSADFYRPELRKRHLRPDRGAFRHLAVVQQ